MQNNTAKTARERLLGDSCENIRALEFLGRAQGLSTARIDCVTLYYRYQVSAGVAPKVAYDRARIKLREPVINSRSIFERVRAWVGL